MFESNKNSMINWRSNVSSLSDDNTNSSENLKCSTIWKRNQSSLLRIVESRENVTEWFIFKWVLIADEDEWLTVDRNVNQMTIKSLIAIVKKILMSSWLAYKMQNCPKTDTLKNREWCRFVYVQIIAWMMLSIVMRNVWIDWFRNYGRQNVNLCTVIANQLFDHHSFNMKWRQNLCQKPCQNIWFKFISSNLALCHNNLRRMKSWIVLKIFSEIVVWFNRTLNIVNENVKWKQKIEKIFEIWCIQCDRVYFINRKSVTINLHIKLKSWYFD